ncbi:hypothetical protein [Paenibacillus sp. HJGM_3]|uniref:hypothetical protein n=1 Tax=Paenibacillus sp. HJGM_3 TaxID=3379816 RepID=UPI00385C86DA
MAQERKNNYRTRVETVLSTCGEPVQALLLDLLQETERLSEENGRLRQALVKASRASGMSSKLKDALYE